MKEVINSCQDQKGFLKRATAIAGGLVLLTACDQQPKITDGTVYKKQYTEKRIIYIPEQRGLTAVPHPYGRPEEWTVYIAQCPKGELPPQDEIKERCKTNSFAVPQEVYNSLQFGQHADFKQTK